MPYKDPEKQREAQKKWEKENRGAGTRHKVWMFIFYEGDAEEGWREEAEEMGLPFLVSPLHDRDAWTAADERKNPKHIEGELKVAHRHGLAEYPNPVSYEQVKEDFAFLHTHSIKYVKSRSAMALYLTHRSAPEKTQYDAGDVLEFGGANYLDWCAEVTDVHRTMREMRVWLRENVAIHHWEFSDFVDWCDENDDQWSWALDLKCAWAIGNYMDKQRNKRDYRARLDRECRRDNEGDAAAGE